MLGAALLWFGWFGFNAGSALGANVNAAIAFANTMLATSAAVIGWLIVEKLTDGKPTSVGAGSGAVAGLVAITPSCANLAPGWALLLGLIAGALCALAIELKFKLGFDDSLDVVGIHMVGGFIGTLYLGFFAIGTGLFTGGDLGQIAAQAIAAFGVAVFSFLMALVIGFAIEKTIGFRVKNEDEIAGVDVVVHGEEGYALVE
jgi:Amt family ammonium transporter